MALIALLAVAAAVEPVGHLADADLDELSGLVARAAGGFWGVEDSGNAPRLYAIGPAGEATGVVRLLGADNLDWEDVSAWTRADGTRFVIVPDVGDNDSRRYDVNVYAVRESDLEAALPFGRANVAMRWDVSYERGPADVEAVAVTSDGRILFLTKRQEPPVLHVASLADRRLATRILGPIAIPPPTDDERRASDYGSHRSWPTAMDVGPDGALYVQTYGDLYVVPVVGDGWDLDHPRRVDTPDTEQTEAGAARDGAWWLSSEGQGAPLYRIDLPP